MELRHLPDELPGLPAPEGAHRLAWSYLLDTACADAFHAGATQLDLHLPAGFADELRAREPFPATATNATGSRLARFALGAATSDSLVRYYRLRFGPLAPATLRSAAAAAGGAPAPATFERVASLYVYTLRTRVLGIPMRLMNLLDHPQPADRALIALRHAFASTRPTPSFYLLETWAPRS